MRDDAQCVDAAAHQRRDSRIDHPMPLELRASREGRSDQRHAVMAAFTGACMARVAGAVIDHLDGKWRERLFQGGADLSCGGFARARLRFLVQRAADSKRSRIIAFPGEYRYE